MKVVCFTSLAFGSLPQARVLAETVRAAHPDWALWAVLVDRPPPGYANRAAFAGFDRVLDVEELGIPRVLSWLFQYEVHEACSAVNRAMVRYLLRLDADIVVCLAADIAVFHPLVALHERLASASVLLAAPQAERLDPDDFGLVAVRNDDAGLRFAAATDDTAGRAFPEGVAIVADPGWNLSSRAVSQYRLRFEADGGLTVDGSPLTLCRFSDFDAAAEAHEPHEVWRWYRRRVAALAEPGIPDDWWHFSRFSDGTPISRAARLLARERPDVTARFEDPFSVEGDSFFRWLQQVTREKISSDAPTTPAGR